LPDVAAQLAVQLRQLAGVRSDEAPKALLQVAYPIAYPELLDDVAKTNGLDPLFVAAMVRQESFWDRNAGSHAGALGLTQVIPPTGEAIAESLGYRDFAPEDLFRPAVSLEFGAYYLAGQLARFGDPYRALAAYNAGPGNVLRWNEQVDGATAADWVAAVDITETKSYVTLVMEHYAHYKQAWR
jgi:soluble lytic murein transglycosylase